MSIDLRCGRWQDVLADVECDALICDPPYSERTHSGHDAASRRDASRMPDPGKRPKDIGYAFWDAEEMRSFAEFFHPRVRGWIVLMSDHAGAAVFEAVLSDLGRYVFAPLPYVATGSRIRLAGDGPSCWTCWIVVARPRTREFQRWGTLDGAYILPPKSSEELAVVGGKPLWLMRALVRDYSRPGDLICDPCAGGATTLLAAAMEGRRAVGAEMDPETYAKAQKRIAKGYTPPLFTEDRPEPEQTDWTKG